MSTITDQMFDGGRGARGSGKPTQATVLQEVADDVAALRAAIVALTAKLDADTGITDTNYNTLDPAAMKTINGS